ncbi:MAG: hypothetical protein AAB680_05940 [Pseudomonadota bacterium]
MNLMDMVQQYANYFQIPPAVIFLGPISLALALQIMKSSESRQKLHASGAWKGMKIESQGSPTIASLCSLILIVSMTYTGYQTYINRAPPQYLNPAYFTGR